MQIKQREGARLPTRRILLAVLDSPGSDMRDAEVNEKQKRRRLCRRLFWKCVRYALPRMRLSVVPHTLHLPLAILRPDSETTT